MELLLKGVAVIQYVSYRDKSFCSLNADNSHNRTSSNRHQALWRKSEIARNLRRPLATLEETTMSRMTFDNSC